MIDLPTTPGGFRVIVADPPWQFKSNSAANPGRNPRRHYDTMSLDDIKGLPVGDIAAPDCGLFLWITAPFLAVGAHLPIMKAWGFKPSTILTWTKLKQSYQPGWAILHVNKQLHVGTGMTFRGNAEFVVLGKRGRSIRQNAGVLGTFLSPVREHSRKPDDFFAMVERYSEGPYCELFARQSRSGWATWGNESTKFDVSEDCIQVSDELPIAA